MTDRRSLAVLLLLLFVHVDVYGQLVRVNMSISRNSVRIEADPFEFRDASESDANQQLVRDADNNVIGVQQSACVGISAPENIPVIVTVGVQDISNLRGRPRPVSFDARYINDGQGCPRDVRLAMDVSKPFNPGGMAVFQLDRTPALVGRLPGSPRRVTGFLYLTGEQRARQENEAVYQGRVTIEIEYI